MCECCYLEMHVTTLFFNVGCKQNGKFKAHKQIVSKLYIEYLIRSHAEASYQLQTILDVQSKSVRNYELTDIEYRRNQLSLGMDTEHGFAECFTGLHTWAGVLMSM